MTHLHWEGPRTTYLKTKVPDSHREWDDVWDALASDEANDPRPRCCRVRQPIGHSWRCCPEASDDALCSTELLGLRSDAFGKVRGPGFAVGVL